MKCVCVCECVWGKMRQQRFGNGQSGVGPEAGKGQDDKQPVPVRKLMGRESGPGWRWLEQVEEVRLLLLSWEKVRSQQERTLCLGLAWVRT